MTRREIAEASGASPADITNWACFGWLPSTYDCVGIGTGHYRAFTGADLAAARLAVEARRYYGGTAVKAVLERLKAAIDDVGAAGGAP